MFEAVLYVCTSWFVSIHTVDTQTWKHTQLLNFPKKQNNTIRAVAESRWLRNYYIRTPTTELSVIFIPVEALPSFRHQNECTVKTLQFACIRSVCRKSHRLLSISALQTNLFSDNGHENFLFLFFLKYVSPAKMTLIGLVSGQKALCFPSCACLSDACVYSVNSAL